jgi:hypothetical protein
VRRGGHFDAHALNVITIVGVEFGSEICAAGKAGRGMVTSALLHSLRCVRPGRRLSLLGVASRAMQWLRSEEGTKSWMSGSLTSNLDFEMVPNRSR